MKMKGYIFLLVHLAHSSGLSIPGLHGEIVGVENNTNEEDLTLDDIREPPNFQRSTLLPGDQLWTSPVPYVLDKGLDLNAKGVIMRAFEQFRVKSCIDFKPWDSEEYYIKIQKLDGCWSYIGRQLANGQDLSIGAGCDTLGVVEHELLHALGFYHEQSRYDRDDYVLIEFANILAGKENNFVKARSNESTTYGVPYDYMSVMHYGKNAFSNGNGPTIITINPKFQDVIGQRLEMSSSDALELNLRYNCSSTVAFNSYCGFSNGTMCQMSRCSQGGISWEVVTQVYGGPSSDHTSLPSGNGDNVKETGYFIHVSTTSGQEGDSARLETEVVKPTRACNVQCLQFYYFHSGNTLDELNIWIREFQNEQDTTGTLRLMEQITGSPTSHWTLHHVFLNATKDFQVVFEVRKGAGNSTGGFSIDDINLSETECPHFAWQIDDLEILLNTSRNGAIIYSPRQFSKDGYAYRVATIFNQKSVSLFVQLLSSKNDNQLQYPCLQRHMIFQLMDQNPNKQLQMSKQYSFVSNENQVLSNSSVWDNPRKTKFGSFNENGELIYNGPLFGYNYFVTLQELQSREFLKGGSAIFMFNFEDLTPLIDGTTLPCPQLRPVNIANPPPNRNESPCSARVSPSINPPSTTPEDRTSSTVHPPPTTDNRTWSTIILPIIPPAPTKTGNRTTSTIHPLPTTDRTSSTVHPPPTTGNRISSTIIPPLDTTTDDRTSSTIHPPPTTDKRISPITIPKPDTTTDDRTPYTIIPPPDSTTDNRISTTTIPPPTTTDDSIFCFCPGMVASPILTVMLALILLLS
ncbi:meprin A subunit beta-like isoform X1 [Xiphophorus couchianus]|uniref:meprin A subunit beta-like isoform X1 n=1 Tax=Xiphophorus couchianus TaxID=32473 RepID=UPI00101601DA|nr:meprin A subunit beta-like isoform X1 [Xiphophorus couchianus]